MIAPPPQQNTTAETSQECEPVAATAEVNSGGSLRLFDLIIAINTYQHANIRDLSGSVNDGNAFLDFLTSKLGVPTANILKLYNQEATREKIIQSFKTHLILYENIRKGDAMVFFYAGHGSSVKAPQNWQVKGDYVETIVPYDEGAIIDNEHIYGIPDRTFDGLMRQLAFVKGDNIVSIMIYMLPSLAELNLWV